ncbi:hypothetical protein VTJ04DRAFT_8531 [Mycothermus thermophilus]|uniref:uncharacterized protein n=1 Tax=Humicola insolens TaxID=85995 RepID=UPI0037447A5E
MQSLEVVLYGPHEWDVWDREFRAVAYSEGLLRFIHPTPPEEFWEQLDARRPKVSDYFKRLEPEVPGSEERVDTTSKAANEKELTDGDQSDYLWRLERFENEAEEEKERIRHLGTWMLKHVSHRIFVKYFDAGEGPLRWYATLVANFAKVGNKLAADRADEKRQWEAEQEEKAWEEEMERRKRCRCS